MKSLDLSNKNDSTQNSELGYTRRAESALNNLRGQLIDQWHFRMLNDFGRNSLYEKAIAAAIDHLLLTKV